MLSSREDVAAAFEALRAARSRVNALSFDALTVPERLTYLEALEHDTRRAPVAAHALINQIAEQADEKTLGGRLPTVLAERLRITRADAGRRVAEAAELGPRQALTGEPLPPLLEATAAAQAAGRIGAAHVKTIRNFLHRLPDFVDLATRERVHADLAQMATQVTPEQLDQLATHIMDCLHPDGDYTDEDRARRRGLVLGKQGPDGMTKLTATLTPEAAATVEAILAKLAAPGMCNPDDDQPVIDGPAPEQAARRDLRSEAQRNHDALLAAGRALLASNKLGQHNGLPATIIVTTTLTDLEAAAGTGLTGGGTLLPMSDVIRLTRDAHNYLAIFDNGKALALYHARRLASPAQRLVLYAKDRGCTRPHCTVPGYRCEVHHVQPWSQCGTTDINNLTFACGADHPLVEPGGYTTRKNAHGDTEWIPPERLDHGQPRTNPYHHPERFLRKLHEDDP